MIQRLFAYKEDKTSETSLIMGSIEVSLKNNPGKKYLLKLNQKLILSNDLPVKAAKSRVEVALPEIAWQPGRDYASYLLAGYPNQH